jgi:anti-anti-sigma factor
MNFTFSLTEKDKVCHIKLNGNLMEKGQATELMEEINGVINRGTKHFILDFKDFQYMNSSGLTIMLHILTKSRKAGGETLICNINEKLKSVFTITRLTDVFTIVDNQETAFASI